MIIVQREPNIHRNSHTKIATGMYSGLTIQTSLSLCRALWHILGDKMEILADLNAFYPACMTV